MTYEIAKELKRFGFMVNCVAPGGMLTPGCFSNGPVASLIQEKQDEINRETQVMKSDQIPTADSVAMVVYGMCTRMADFLCVERAAMSVELSKLQKEGLLKTDHSHFELNIAAVNECFSD